MEWYAASKRACSHTEARGVITENSSILRHGVFFTSIVYGEMSKMFQEPPVHRIFTGKKDIGLWGTLNLFCYWWCCPFPMSGPHPSMLVFSCSHHLPPLPTSPLPSLHLIPLSPPTTDICRSTLQLKKEKKKKSIGAFCIFLSI